MIFVWGMNYVAAKVTLLSFPPLVLAPLRIVVAAGALGPIYAWRVRRRPQAHVPLRRSGRILALGVLGITLNQVLFVVGISSTSVAHGALLVALTPVLVLLFASLRGQERMSLAKLGGMTLAIAGVAALQVTPGRDTHGTSYLGDALVFGSALVFALYTVIGKESTRQHDPVTVNALGFAAGALMALPLLWWGARRFDFSTVHWFGWTMLAYMALFPSVLCYLIYYFALARIPASRLSSFSYAQPVIAAASGFLILAEPVTLPVMLGGALVLAGVWLAGRR
jgi:drug/metabolite transporter (DMT)-like permease